MTPEQHELRKTMVTATNSIVLSGERYYDRSAMNVFNEKLGIEAPWDGNTATRVGRHNEPLALTLLAEELGLTLEKGTTERHPLIPWSGATPDASVIAPGGDRIAVAEAKMVGLRSARAWGILPPSSVVVQVTKQMVVTRTKVAHVVALFGTEPKFYVVEYDDGLGSALLELDEDFWKNHVEKRVPPSPDATEGAAQALKELYPRVKGDVVRASPEVEELAREYFARKAELEKLEEQILGTKNMLKAAIGAAAGIEGDGWTAKWSDRKGSVSWKKAVEALLKDTPKDAFERFRGEGTRVFECEPIAKGGT